MTQDKIVIKGAREHNLKNVNLELPRDKLIVMTGLSGSGKSSLAFDTIYAEGQRRYVESLSSYARQFLGQMEKPDVDHIDGLSPAVSIDQKTTSRNPRSTVGTVTEVYDYLRLLYARVGIPHCVQCGRPIAKQSAQQIIDQVMAVPEGTKFQVMAPLVKGRKGEFRKIFDNLRREGFARVKVDGEVRLLEEAIKLDKNYKHTIEVIIDRLVMKADIKRRLADSIELALKLAEGAVDIELLDGDATRVMSFSEHFACLDCGISFEELAPRQFSFNSPYGACPECTGLGNRPEIDPELIIASSDLTIDEGVIHPFTGKHNYYPKLMAALARVAGFSTKVPWGSLSPEHRHLVLYGEPRTTVQLRYIDSDDASHAYRTTYEGVIPNLMRRFKETESDYARDRLSQYMRVTECPACRGTRLKPASLAVTVNGKNINELCRLPITASLAFTDGLQAALSERELMIAARILKEIKERLRFLVDVGLDYLTLERAAATLSGGEAQRIRLATQIGSGLMGVLYILDEPTIGLHQRDNARLIATLKRLRDLGNTLIVVEHDEATIRAADYVVDIGPGAGEHGGAIIAVGTPAEIIKNKASITGQYLAGKVSIPVPATRRAGNGKRLVIRGAAEHNLKEIDVELPLAKLICVTGVSGSGKSTLVSDILAKALAVAVYKSRVKPGRFEALEGIQNIDKVVEIDQSPIGRTPRSNPATYSGVFSDIRTVFTTTKEAKVRGYKPGRFSFNVKGGRCEACRGDGTIKIEMHFLPDIFVPCEVCKGKRYNEETLEVKFKAKNIAEVLDMSVEEAVGFFANIPTIKRRLTTLFDVGLGYIKLGQPAPTLSGGEAQRVKLASELSRVATGCTFYILDEPTTGLHFADAAKLLSVLQRLVDSGNTVLVIEHNLDIIKSADHIIDLGPEGGDRGGRIVASGTPEEIAAHKKSYTGRYLKPHLNVSFPRKRESVERETKC
ncbi:MAG: excinuclease ABC subunit UvrA [Actinomycetota bacterium]|nr:excinuclease ABC subunit UvrA [Actinomycetota bacterium]